MRFVVSRTSTWDEKPCDEAAEGSYVMVDIRTADDPAKVPAYGGDTAWWWDKGENHRLVDGQIARDFADETAWFIDIPDLDALLAFIEKHGGHVVIESFMHNPDFLEIEIYDGYRE